MSAGFETLIYTDCRPGQGLRGSSGLQFQAQSPGTPPEAQSTVQRHLLYEPPSSWMSERRPPADYPPSFAHVADGLYATAAGVYLGQEANGTREGNQLTHSIVTRDPSSYAAPIRPAQLYRAPFWVTRPAATTSCPPIPAGWQPGPYGVEDTRDYIVNQPDGAARLAVLLTALHQIGGASGTRVLLIGEDPDQIMRWIVAGTLLLPYERALEIGFKVFSTTPAQAVQPVLAVHPGWGTPVVRVDNDLGYVVIDLSRNETSKLDPTEVAQGWAYDFCESRDAYDIMDAVQVAGESGLDLEPAAILGRAAVLGEPLTVSSATAITDWLGETPATLLASYRGRLVDRITADVDQWPHRLVLALDGLAHSGQVPADRAAAVRVALIRAELGRAAQTGEAAPTKLPRLAEGSFTADHRRAAERAVVDMLRRATPTGFDAVLRVARRFDLTVDLAAARSAVDAFVADWADHPGRGWDPRQWDRGQEIEDRLVDALNARVVDRPAAAAAMARRWLPVLRHRIVAGHVDGPMAEAIVSVWIVEHPKERERLVSSVLANISTRPAGDESAGRAVSMLWSHVPPTPAELSMLAELAPTEIRVDPRVFEGLTKRLTVGDPTPGDLDLGCALEGKRIWSPVDSVFRLLSYDRVLVAACKELTSGVPGTPQRPVVERMLQTPQRLVATRLGVVARAMTYLEDRKLVNALVNKFPFVVGSFVPAVRDRLGGNTPGSVAAIGFWLSQHQGVPDKMRKQVASELKGWIKATPEGELAVAAERLEQWSGDLADAWEDEVKAVRGRGFFKRFRSGRSG